MSEEKKQSRKHEIAIPETIERSKLLQCLVEPPHDWMEVSLTLEGDKEPFQVGKILSRRCPEISVFMFRPCKLNMTTRKRDVQLKDGDKVNVKVTLYETGDANKRTFKNKIQDAGQQVIVTCKPVKAEPGTEIEET